LRLCSASVAVFFIDTDTGQVATVSQLIAGGLASANNPPPRPWHRIQGTSDATTLWYAVLRRATKGIFIGTLVVRHCDHYASLLRDGWQEVPVDEIGLGPSPAQQT
jgi:hypothetical protein